MQYVHKEVKEVLEEERDILVGHLNLKDPLVVQVLLPIGIRKIGVTRTAHMMNSRRLSLLRLMVR